MTCMCVWAVGYWPSYNIPFYPIIYNLTGYLAVSQLVPSLLDDVSYQVSARAKIMRRDQSKVVDVKSLQEFARYNGTNAAGTVQFSCHLLCYAH